MARLRPTALGLAATALVASACGGATHAASDPATTSSAAASAAGSGAVVHVVIKNFAFSPADITVHPGQQVEWTNEDPTVHTVTAVNRVFNSGDLSQGKTFTYTFTKVGSYSYLCLIHQFMTGKVTVS